jgi:uncharacterized protein
MRVHLAPRTGAQAVCHLTPSGMAAHDTGRNPTMMNAPLPAPLDVHEFSREAQCLSGELPVAALPRLAESVESDTASLAWRFAGQSVLRPDGSREARAELSLLASLTMRCTRCLQPLACPLDEHRAYRFVGSEAQAQAEDSDDELFDVLVASRQFDLAGLIEDEALMALPLAPRHAHCETPALVPSATSLKAPPAAASADAPRDPAWRQALSGLRAQVRGEEDDAKD